MNWVKDGYERMVSWWLLAIVGLIFAMIILGGLTRLTESGLSIVDWDPIMGAIPPLSAEAWNAAFEKYKAYPQYQKAFPDMTLGEFEFIFMMEYSHRLLGRLIGLVFFIPMVLFMVRGVFRRPFIWRSLMLFFLGGLQGVIGWYMVKSGLVNEPRVSQYRLVLHLSTAMLVLSLALWYVFNLRVAPPVEDRPFLRRLRKVAIALLVLLGLQIAGGGFVAGMRAGYAFNTFPTMNGRWIPDGFLSIEPWYRNFFENPATVQFMHRWMAMIVTAAVLTFVLVAWRRFYAARIRKLLVALVVTLLAQVGLGIATLLLAVPVALASLHQAVALVLWSLLLFMVHQCAASARIPTNDAAKYQHSAPVAANA